ncbi:uncharacterized protein LOC129949949 [Eupeodes corollae]|uniref:uncharacterized protein LOC129949949 n=1 Tax=Eupeodes corollae TaxID=290404 RepID=UPI002490C3EB|nr:uncharacterized protein LOC129949949 [Eupeodes corollae]
MQKRVRKNSDISNCPKKIKLDITPHTTTNNDQDNGTTILKNENEIKSESLIRTPTATIMSSSVDSINSDLSDVNIIVDKFNNPMLKTFTKSSDSDSMDFKEVYHNKDTEGSANDEHHQLQQHLVDSVSNLQENSESFQDSGKDSMETLSNFKLLHRESDILIDFETNTSVESITNNQTPEISDSSICLPTENDIFSILEPKDTMKKTLETSKSVDDKQNRSHEEKKTQAVDDAPKFSIGNATISVPLLKPLNFRRIATNDGKSVPNIVRKVINIRGNKIKAPTIVQLSQVHLNSKMNNSKIVQATLVGNKIQLPNIGFKSTPGSSFSKQNFVQPSQLDVTTLPKQIFEDEMVFLDNTPMNQEQQAQNPQAEDNVEATSIENLIVSNKTQQKPKDSHIKTVAYDEQVPRSSPSYVNQCRLIETDSNVTKSLDSTTTEATPTSVVASSTNADNMLPRMTTCLPKTVSRKPLILTTKTITTSEVSSGKDASRLNDTKQIVDNTMIGKMLEENFLLRKQIALAVQNNVNRLQLKVTKTTEENKVKRIENRNVESVVPNQSQQKRPISKSGQIPVNESTSTEKIEKPINPKSDETQNVLLKHLLQSSISQRSNPGCNQSLAPRKLATVRAPSLGVVSSLEAQLARPVIPPVSSVGDLKPEIKILNKGVSDKAKKNTGNDRDVAVSALKNKSQMISRETSFVSAFSPKAKNPNELERSINAPANANQIVQADTISKPVAIQQTAQNTNNNYSSINVFKFFKQKEQSANDGTISENNSNNVQNKLLSPQESADTKMSIKSEIDDTRSSPTVKSKLVKMDIEQNTELRRKFKRDYQKHKRYMLHQKDPLKKRPRKLSKATEDFDEFIENKVVQMKQMFVLEVLEPLLSTFLGICSVYGYNDKVKNQYPYQSSSKDDFGKINLKNYVDFYSVEPYGSNRNDKPKIVTSFQNKFYDEEFSTVNEESYDKLFQFINNLKHLHLQLPSENVSVIPRSPPYNELKSKSLLNLTYPGIKTETNFNLNSERMSPVLSVVNPKYFGGVVKRKKKTHLNLKNNYGVETAVILKLSSFVAENILDILRDLDNLLNVQSPASPAYKVLNNNKANLRKGLYVSRIKNLQKTESTNIQNFLNGTYKCCRNCHLTIVCGIVGSDSNSNIKQKILSDVYFCDKFCCIQYKKKGKRFVVTRKKARCLQSINNKNNNNTVNQVINTNNEKSYCNTSNYKVVGPNTFWKPTHKTTASEDANEMALKMRIAITISSNKDTRRCVLCNQKGDSFVDGSSRLLNYDVNKWVHLNCALWSNSVYETINGGLMNLELTMQQGSHQICTFCNQYGASIKCFKMRCTHMYHLPCAIKEQCVFYKNKTIHCASHAHRMDKKNELSTIRVKRRVYIERDENRQVAAVMHHLELSNLLRIGNLTFINVGQLLPHQLEAFHSRNYIYPIGYKIIRFFWSTRKLNKRCRYICSIVETNGRPEFVIQIQEQFENDVELRDISPKAVWQRVLDKIVLLRKGQSIVQLFTEFITGEDMFGLSEPSIVRILESLPGVESLTDYRFKYGRNPLLELPLALNPSGSARTEPKQKHIVNWKKAHTQRTSSINVKFTLSPSSLVAGEVACPYSKQFVHSKSSQYRKMKQEWRNNVYLARSKIQGLGLYAARDLEKHTMVIEYIGQVIRTEVSELREKQYDLRNRGIYMFRLDEERVVDATLSGGLARYINHSCNPNCVTEIVDVDREYRIIIFAKRRINKGEELSYDYKFDIEDDAHKISCMCEAPNCRKWMN